MPKKILFVDDDYNILNLLENFLSMKGFEVQTAENGYFALKKIQSFKPDLVLLDIMMPRMNGYEVCAKIREFSDPDLARTPIIIISALNHLNDVKKAIAAGANDYLVKPINLQALFDKISRYLEVTSVIQSSKEESNLLTVEKLEKGLVISIQGKLNSKTLNLLENNIHHLPSTEFVIVFLQNIQEIEDITPEILNNFFRLFNSLSLRKKTLAVEQKELYSLVEPSCLKNHIPIFGTLMEAYEEVKKT
jgi:DNA-binding response OmpR family regulator